MRGMIIVNPMNMSITSVSYIFFELHKQLVFVMQSTYAVLIADRSLIAKADDTIHSLTICKIKFVLYNCGTVENVHVRV